MLKHTVKFSWYKTADRIVDECEFVLVAVFVDLWYVVRAGVDETVVMTRRDLLQRSLGYE